MTITTSVLEFFRTALGSSLVLINALVWHGVRLEGDEYPPDIKEIGSKVLLRSLAAEAALAMLLLATDTAISERQKAEILSLEVKIAPRRLSEEQREAIRRSPSSGQRVIVVSRVIDSESGDFADDLAMALTDAHWANVSRTPNWITSIRGIFIGAVPGINFSESEVLAKALNAANIEYKPMAISGDAVRSISPQFESGTLYLLVGVKP
jgi:hypothetical protein